MALYSIAGAVLGLESAPEDVEKYFEGFECEEPGAAPDIRLMVISADELPEPAVRPSMKAVFGVRYAALPAGEEQKLYFIIEYNDAFLDHINHYILNNDVGYFQVHYRHDVTMLIS